MYLNMIYLPYSPINIINNPFFDDIIINVFIKIFKLYKFQYLSLCFLTDLLQKREPNMITTISINIITKCKTLPFKCNKQILLFHKKYFFSMKMYIYNFSIDLNQVMSE